MPKVDGWLTVREAARRLKVDESLVTRYARQKRFKAVLLGKQWLIEQKSFDKFAAEPRPMGNPLLIGRKIPKRWRAPKKG